VIPAALDSLTNIPAGVRTRAGAVEEAEVLGPWHIHEHAQTQVVRLAQEPCRRKVVGTQGVDSHGSHGDKVIVCAFVRWERLPVGVGGKRAIGHSMNPQALRPLLEKLAVHADARTCTARRRQLVRPC
jgi:hypothetical protein